MPRLSYFWFVNRTQRRRQLQRFRTKTSSHELACSVSIFMNLKIFSCIINNAHGSIKYGRVQAKNSEAMHCLMFHLLRSMHRQLTEIRRQRSFGMQCRSESQLHFSYAIQPKHNADMEMATKFYAVTCTIIIIKRVTLIETLTNSPSHPISPIPHRSPFDRLVIS